MRTGKEYVNSLNDGRGVYLDGQLVRDVTTHPAFAPAIGSVAQLYDLATDPENAEIMTYRPAASDASVNKIWLIPKSIEDLEARRKAHQLWQEASFGLMGRSPDHVAAFITGFASSLDIFARGGGQFAENVLRFYQKAREQDLYLAYVIVPPQGDRSKPAHQQPDPHFYAGVVKERDDGIIVKGAQGIGTGALMSNYVLLTCIVPLRSGDENYAISVVVPTNASGLRLYPRRSYATMGDSTYDYPLSSRFDESDSLLVFDDVFVPWEDVFIYKNIELTQAQFFEGPAHVLGNFQALVRLWIKLQFLLGLCKRVCEMHGSVALPPVQAQLGELAAYVSQVEAFVRAAEKNPIFDRNGVARPNPEMVYGGLILQPAICNTMLQSIRELVGGGVIAVPSSASMFLSPLTSSDVRKYYQSGNTGAEERVRLLKLIWDLVGTEFGGRQLQYEMFYAGAPFIVRARNYRAYDWCKSNNLIDRCLAEYNLPDTISGGSNGGS